MIKTSVKRVRWIIGVFAPIFLALFITGSFSYFIFSGPIHGNLAGKADNFLLENILIYGGGYKLSADVPVTVVDIGEEELAYMRSNRRNGVGDINIEEYAAILRKVWRHKPRLIILRWLPMAHEGIEPEDADYGPLIDEMKSIGSPKSVILGYPVTGEFKLPKELKAHSTLLDDEICSAILQTCPYVTKWDDWVIQVMLNEISAQIGPPPHLAITRSFSTIYPNFILNLPSPEELVRVSPKNLDDHGEKFRDRIVFIGRDVPKTAQVNLWNGVSLVGATTTFNLKDSGKYGNQTPLHTFWAQIAAMHYSNHMVSVLPWNIVVVAAALLCIVLVVLTFSFGANLGLSVFLISAATLITVDFLALRYVQFYIPPFFILYCSFLTLVTAGFLKISYEIYIRSRIQERKKAIDFAADLKGNFISLVSHNLNTPVAKLQGMVELLQSFSKGSPAEEDVSRCVHLTSKLSLAVQIILATIRLRDGGVDGESVRLQNISDDFNNKFGNGLLRKMNLPASSQLSDENLDNAELPFRCDHKGLVLFMASLAVIHHQRQGPTLMHCNLEIDDKNFYILRVYVPAVTSASAVDFYGEICQDYAKLFMLSYMGLIYHESKGQVCYKLTLT